MADLSDLTEVKAWVHYYAPQPLKSKLEVIIRDAERMREIIAIAHEDGMASDGMDMINYALEEKVKRES